MIPDKMKSATHKYSNTWQAHKHVVENPSHSVLALMYVYFCIIIIALGLNHSVSDLTEN